MGDDERKRMEFVQAAIREHKSSDLYQTAVIAEQYYKGLNVSIGNYQKFVYDAFGRSVPDIWSPNHKIACHYYKYLVTQLALFLLGNGVSFADKATKEKLGAGFDKAVLNCLIDALNGAVSYGFADNGILRRFKVTEFEALQDEETSAIRAGIRWWQLDKTRPLRVTLYEEDGFTEYIQPKGEDMRVFADKRAYVQVLATSDAGGTEIVEERNYPTFPIVPLYNYGKISELTGTREAHDALDLMLSGLINNVDGAEVIYWLLKNSGGMDQPSLNRFLQTIKTTHIVPVENNEDVSAHSPQVQFAASKEAIDQLRRQVFDNHMGLDVRNIASGAATATQIKAAYEPLNAKADLVEYCVTEFIQGVLAVMGIEDAPTYTRSYIINQQEAVQTIETASNDLPQTYRTRKILEILGDIDKAEEVLADLTAEDAGRLEPDEDEGGEE